MQYIDVDAESDGISDGGLSEFVNELSDSDGTAESAGSDPGYEEAMVGVAPKPVDKNTNTTSYTWTYFVEKETDAKLDGPYKSQVYIEEFVAGLEKAAQCSYIVAQLERSSKDKGEERLHVQGYMQFKKTIRFNTLKRHLPPGTHIQGSRGSPKDNFVYCTKDETRVPGTEPVEWGTRSVGKGHRTDLVEVMEMITDGKSINEVRLAHQAAFIRYTRGIEAAYRVQDEFANSERIRRTATRVFWGPTSTGKSLAAFREAQKRGGGTYIWRASSNVYGFPCYTNQRNLILDEFEGSERQMPITHLLVVLDGLPEPINKFGAVCFAAWTRIWITSQSPPRSWYSRAPAAIRAAMLARLQERDIRHMHAMRYSRDVNFSSDDDEQGEGTGGGPVDEDTGSHYGSQLVDTTNQSDGSQGESWTTPTPASCSDFGSISPEDDAEKSSTPEQDFVLSHGWP